MARTVGLDGSIYPAAVDALMGRGKTTQQQPDRGPIVPGFATPQVGVVHLAQAPVASGPGPTAFGDPAAWQHCKADLIEALGDMLEDNTQLALRPCGQAQLRVFVIDPNPLQRADDSHGGGQQALPPVG